MGDEFIAEIAPEAIGSLDILFAAPGLLALVELLDSQQSVVTMRWRHSREQTNWPEDITVSMHAEGLIVCFHSWTDAQPEAFLQALAEALQKSWGISAVFEEL